MRIIIIVFLILGWTKSSYSQNNEMEFGIDFQPVLSEYVSSKSFIYRSSIFFIKNINKKWSISAGIGFSDLGLQNTITLDTSNIRIQAGDSEIFAYRKGAFKYQYLNFPLNVLYKINRLNFSIGLHPHLFYRNEKNISTDYIFQTSIHKTFSSDQINKLNIAANLGVEYNLSLGKNWTLLFRSTGSYFLIPIYKHNDSPPKVKQFSLGLSFGIKRLLSLGNKKIITNGK